MNTVKDTEVIYDAEFGSNETGKAVRVQATATNFSDAREALLERVVNEGDSSLVNVLGYIGYLESSLDEVVEAARVRQARIELLLKTVQEIAQREEVPAQVRKWLNKIAEADQLANLLLQNEEAAKLFMDVVGDDNE
nr:MAG TPA: hypothetical protein [Caudoviricetes sp.]